MSLETYRGSCHCGAVRYAAALDLAEPTFRCNCSLCSKSRNWFAIAAPGSFRLSAGADMLATYRWCPPGRETATLDHLFCRHCGIRLVGRGQDTELGGEFHAVVLATLDDAPADALAGAPVVPLDGRRDRFDATPEDTRLLV